LKTYTKIPRPEKRGERSSSGKRNILDPKDIDGFFCFGWFWTIFFISDKISDIAKPQLRLEMSCIKVVTVS